MQRMSKSAQAFIVLMVLAGLGVATMFATADAKINDYFRFASFLVVAVLAARLKVKLPNLTGSMSVNLPFILLAICQLSGFEAILIASVSTLAQSLGGKSKPVQMVFNVCNVALAVGIAFMVFTATSHLSASLAIAAAGLTYFLVNTLGVAIVIALSETQAAHEVWFAIGQWSFPYYVAAIGVAAVALTAVQYVGGYVPLAILPVMYFIHRSYRMFAAAVKTTDAIPASAMAQAAGD